jgi:hypothetical protein
MECYSPAAFVVYAASFVVKLDRKIFQDCEAPLNFWRMLPEFPGGLTARATPVPIPNTEVKPRRADDTALETTRERRSPPGIKLKRAECWSLHSVLLRL